MIDYTRLDRTCACLDIQEVVEGPGSYTLASCKLNKFNPDCKDCIGCEFCNADIPGTTQSRVMTQLASLGF